MPRCSQGCRPPKIDEGRHVDITGTGTTQDPLQINVTTDLDVLDNTTFNLILTGNGELSSPWRLEVAWAPTATIGDLPDVTTDAKANGYVLQWSDSASQWIAAPPVTAAAGSVVHGNGLSGDGSIGNPLLAATDAARYLQVTTSGIGLTDTAIRELVKVYTNDTARAADPLPPMEGSLSVLTAEPKIIWYFDGATWVRASGVKADATDELMPLSGSYAGGPVTLYVRQLEFTTDAAGVFTAIAPGSLPTYAGILSVAVQPTGDTDWAMGNIRVSGSAIIGVARHPGGTVFASTPLEGTLTATLY